jgi:hypothetical protein
VGPFNSGRVLIPSGGGNEILTFNDGKAFGLVTALEFKRLVVGGVDNQQLPSIQIGANARCGVLIDVCRIPDHRLDRAVAISWFKES